MESPTETPPARPFHLGYRPGLDGIRGISVILIMLFHSFVLWGAFYGRVVPGAYVTVNMFFVLSGFLITSLLLTEHERKGKVSFGSFYQRRALRLLPALVFLLLVFTAYVMIKHRNVISEELAAVGWISIYMSNWAQWSGRMNELYTSLSLGHTWTLAVEEQFYLLWPLLIVLVLAFRKRLKVLMWLLLGGVVFVTLERAWLTSRVHIPAGTHREAAASLFEHQVGIRTDARADTLLLGALAAVLLHYGFRTGRSTRIAGTIAFAFLLAVWLFAQPDSRLMYAWGFTLVDIAGAVLCIAVLDEAWRLGTIFRTGPAAWLGRMSYALYLWHLPVFVAIAVDAPDLPVAVALVLAWVITFACALVSYYFIETPFLRLKGRLSAKSHGDENPPVPHTIPEPAAR
jgi:peptidoglycan/LPS O-acetylase OafA/YrhL